MFDFLIDTLTTMFSSLTHLSSSWVFGLFLRCLGGMFAFALGMLISQIEALAGSRGIQPAQVRLNHIHHDFPFLSRYLYFPTLLHPFRSLKPSNFDMVLKLFLIIGCVNGMMVMFGVGYTKVSLFICWTIYLSFTNTVQLLIYPWDYLLLEVGFISMFLPNLPCLFTEGISLQEQPLPLLTLYLRWTLFRLMFGFGKMKFHGASTKESSYLKGFMSNQPLPTCFAVFIHSMPLIVHQIGLILFFVAEIIVPFGFVFASGTIRQVCGLGTMFLQVNIAMSGNFGFFNLLSCVLSITCLDGTSSFWSDMIWSQHVWKAPFTHLLFGGLLGPLTFAYICMNSWCTMSFVHWTSLNLPVTKIGDFLRLLTPWHVIHSYGIFFSQSSPAIRWVPILEGCEEEIEEDGKRRKDEDGKENTNTKPIVWEPYFYKFMTVDPFRRPPFCAPYHFRFDQSIFYDSIGMTPDTFFTSLSSGNPYDFRGDGGTNLERVATQLLVDQDLPNSPIERLFRKNPFPSKMRRVKSIRISLYLYRPASLEEIRTTGRWWHVKYAGLQVRNIMTRRRILEQSVPSSLTPASSSSSSASSSNDVTNVFTLREPSLWHPDHYLWQCQTNLYQEGIIKTSQKIDQFVSKKDDDDSLSTELLSSHLFSDLSNSSNLYTSFWSEFVPLIQTFQRRLFETQRLVGPGTRLQEEDGQHQRCQSCVIEEAWMKTKTTHSGDTDGPVLDWSHEMTQLRTTLRSRFTSTQLNNFRTLLYRLTLLLQHRILQTPDLYSASGPGSQTTKQSEEDEKLQKERMKRMKEVRQACKRHSRGVSITAPTFKENYGFLPTSEVELATKTGQRSRVTVKTDDTAVDKLPLPSFFHLHLYVHHSLLSCQTKEDFFSILQDPTSSVEKYRSNFTIGTGLILPGVFHLDLLRFHSDKARLTYDITFPAQRESGGILPGWLQVYFEFLPYQFQNPQTQPPGLNNIQRPNAHDEVWRFEMENMLEPTVNLRE